jgi:hypothetical protein
MSSILYQRKRNQYLEAQRRTEFERHVLAQLDGITSHLRYRQYMADFPERIPEKSNSVIPRPFLPQFPIPNNMDMTDKEGADLCRSFINSLRIDLE